MNTTKAYGLAVKLLDEHDLLETGWTFKFDRSVRRFGQCNYTDRTISLSEKLTELNTEEVVKETLLHEIAHALTRGCHHNHIWKAVAKSIGCSGERTYDPNTIVQPPAKYILICNSCGYQSKANKKSTNACGKCCKKYNNNKWSEKYVFQYIRNN